MATFKQLVHQSVIELLYSDKTVAGVRTNAVRGSFLPREALARMLNGTGLIVSQGKSNGAFAIVWRPAAGASLPGES